MTEELLNDWGRSHTVKEVCAALDAAGIPNAPVNSIREVAEDPHFVEYRNMFPRYTQPELGEVRVTNLPLRFPEGSAPEIAPAPSFGQQTEEVLKELLHMEVGQIREWKDKGVLF